MNIIGINMRTVAVALLCVASFAFMASPALADHGDEEEVTSHASTAHEHDSSEAADVSMISAQSVAVTDVARLQQLLSALEQLVELLKEKAQLEHDATPHEHENEDESEHNDEDHE